MKFLGYLLVFVSCLPVNDEFEHESDSISSNAVVDTFETEGVESIDEDKIFVPFLYGLQHDDVGLKCNAGGFGENGQCDIPAGRTVRIGFAEHTCDSWWKTRWANVLNSTAEYYNSFGWDIKFVSLISADYVVRCYNDDTTPMGFFDPSSRNCQQISPDKQLCKYSGGQAAINTFFVENRPIWGTASNTQRRKWANNACRHELSHLLGHGHYQGSQAGTKLMAQGFPLDLSTPVWNEEVGWDVVEVSAIDCFNAGSSTSPLCVP